MQLSKVKISTAIFCPLAVLYMELVLRLLTGGDFFNIGLAFITAFSAAIGLLIFGVGAFFSPKTQRIISGVTLAVLGVLYATQIVYYSVFNNFLIVYSLKAGGADQIMTDGMLDNTLKAIYSGIPAVLLLAIPAVIVFTPLSRYLSFKRQPVIGRVIPLVSAAVVYAAAVVGIVLTPTLSAVQSGLFDTNISMNRFGLIHTEVLDIGYNIFGIEQELELEAEKPELDEGTEKEPEIELPKYVPHTLDIDFEALKATETDKDLILMNEYFAAKEPTYTNDYTGMYKGYNLVMLVAEGFSPYAIDPVLTPTLYKMQQEGFNFQNFYTPVWGVSTSDGEYTACTGLIPKSGVWSFYRSGNNLMPFCLGNMFKSIGVNNTFAYHNNTASYYHRDISHPNMGYNYKGMGTGVEQYVDKVWPQSDHQMVAGSIDEYLSKEEPFHAYYMTVSGHLHYTKKGNYQAAKHWDKVKDLTCSDTLKAYYACNIELDLAMEELLRRLNEAGVADKTVIAITPDHYPYGLERSEGDKYAIWEELLGHPVETQFELYESVFLLYCQSTKNPPQVAKNCYSVDILPTLLNLFGFEYDSRLLMGTDIMSSEDELVVFGNRSFITDKGKYNSRTGSFTPHSNDAFASEEEKKAYIANIKAVVNNKFKMSAKILEEDYYGYLFGKE